MGTLIPFPSFCRFRRVSEVFCLCVLLLFACREENQPPNGNDGEKITVPYINAGFLPEMQTVLISWLPVQPLPPGFKGYLIYRTPPYSIGTALSDPVGFSPLGMVTQTSFEDRRIQGNKSYGYAVSVTYLNGDEGPRSPWIWVDIPLAYVTIPPESPSYNDPCSEPAHPEVESFAVVPLDENLNPISRAVGLDPQETLRRIKLKMRGYFFSPVTLELSYYRHSLFEGVPQTLDNIKFSMPAVTCSEILHSFTLNDINNSSYYLYRFAYKLSKDRFFYLNFPNLRALEWVYLDLSSPPLGSVLASGYHSFSGRIFYKVRAVETRHLSVFIKGSDPSGKEAYLGVFPASISDPSGQVTFSQGIEVPDWVRELRVMAVFAGSNPEDILFYDQVHYHVVP
jgi:hypothetical protein